VVRLVLFDIDGTLIRTRGAGVRAFDRTGEMQFGVRNGTVQMQFAGRTDTSLVQEFFAKHQIPSRDGNFDRFFGCYVFLLDEYLRHSTGSVCGGVASFLGSLAALDPPPVIGLLTGNIRLGAEIKLRHFGLWEVFALGAFGDDHNDRNELARIALRRGSCVLGQRLRGEELLVVGDTPADIICGRAVGARTLAVCTGGADFETLARHQPDWLATDLTTVKADEVCVGARKARAGGCRRR